MKDRLFVFIKVSNINQFIYFMNKFNISIDSIKYMDNGIECFIKYTDYIKISKYYDIKIIKDSVFRRLFIFNKYKFIYLVCFMIWLILFILFSNIVIDVEYSNININNFYLIKNRLESYGIRRLVFFKSYDMIDDIKELVLNEFNDNIEWMEIDRVGLKYIVKIEERIKSNDVVSDDYCNIYANYDGLVTRIISNKGSILVDRNDYVRKGDLLISGDIIYNDEVKNKVCSKGIIYGEVWYSMNISIPKIYKDKFYTKKWTLNLLYSKDNVDYKILRDKYELYDEDRFKIISLLGNKLYLIKDREYKLIDKEYSEEELDKYLDNLIIKNINLNLSDDEKIISKKVLKKEVFDSTIEVEVFVTAEKILGSN